MKRSTTAQVLLVAVVAGLLAGVAWFALSRPAQADHVNEPTAPITEVTMEVYAYPNFSTALTKCDGTEVVKTVTGAVSKNVRVETFVDSTARALGNPSEHFNETLTLFVVLNVGQRNEVAKYEWQASWNHSNIPPHAKGGIGDNGFESSQNEQSLKAYPPGTVLRFQDVIKTLESLQSLETSCTFKVG